MSGELKKIIWRFAAVAFGSASLALVASDAWQQWFGHQLPAFGWLAMGVFCIPTVVACFAVRLPLWLSLALCYGVVYVQIARSFPGGVHSPEDVLQTLLWLLLLATINVIIILVPTGLIIAAFRDGAQNGPQLESHRCPTSKCSTKSTQHRGASTAMKPRKRLGDILEVTLPNGYAYLRYIGSPDSILGFDAFEVLDFGSHVPLSDSNQVDVAISKYAIGSIFSVLIEDERFHRLGRVALGHNFVFPVFRQMSFGGWFIGEQKPDHFVKTLSPEQARMPIFEGVPPGELIDRLVAGWSPEDDVEDAVAALKGFSPKHAGSVRFFLDIPVSESRAFIAEACAGGFGDETLPGARDRGTQEITLCHDVRETADVKVLVETLRAMAAKFNGEVTGYELSA